MMHGQSYDTIKRVIHAVDITIRPGVCKHIFNLNWARKVEKLWFEVKDLSHRSILTRKPM